MARDVKIRAFRSTTANAKPPTSGADGITAGELAANLADGLLFVGASNGGYITYRDETKSVWSVNGATGNVGLKYATARDPDHLVDLPGVTGVATYWCENFVVAANGMVKLGTCCSTFCDTGPPSGAQFPPDANLYYGGIAATFGSDGGLSAFILDIAGLTEDTSSSRSQYIPFVTSSGKTKKISADKFISNMSSVFVSKNSGQLTIEKDPLGDNVGFSVVLGQVSSSDQGLVKGASAYQYLELNTVKTVNGKTGNVSCIAVTCDAQSFSGLQTFINGLSGIGATFANLVVGGYSFPTVAGDEGDVLELDASGNLIFAAAKGSGGGIPSFIVRSGEGATSQITDGDTFTITGGDGVFTIKSASNTVSVRGITATHNTLGVASFPATDFSVASGVVTLTGNVAKTNVTQTFTGLQSFANGISASGITAYSSNLVDPTITLTNVTNPGNLTMRASITDPINNRFASTAFGQYSWLTNLSRSGGIWVKDINDYSAWRMNQLVGTSNANSSLQWAYVTPSDNSNPTLNALAILYGYGDFDIVSGRLRANGATFSGNISAPNIVNSFHGLTGAVAVNVPLNTDDELGLQIPLDGTNVFTIIGDGTSIFTTSGGDTKTVSVYAQDAGYFGTKGVASFTGNDFRVVSGNVSLTAGIVRSVNGRTGNVGLPLATTGLSGVASFSSTDFSVSATGHVSLASPSTGAGGTKTYSVFTARDNNPPATNYATFDTRNSIGTLHFDGLTNEAAVFVGIMPESASYANLQARLKWITTSAVSGSVMWGVKWEQMTTDLDSDDWSSVTELVHTIAGPGSTASGVPYTTAITCTGAFDSITGGDMYRLYVYRGATASSDDITTDVELVAVEVRGV